MPTGDLPVPHDVSELLSLMRTAVDVLREKYPTLTQPVSPPQPPRPSYQWETFFVSRIADITEMLNDVEEGDWEIYNCFPCKGKAGEQRFVAIARKPK